MLTAMQLAEKMNLDPRVRVGDCRKSRSKAEEESPNRALTRQSLSNLCSMGKSLLGNLWGKKSAPSASTSSSTTPIAPGSSSAAVRPRPHLECRHPGCGRGRRFAKASRLAEHWRSHRRERVAAAPDERLPTPGQNIFSSIFTILSRISISFHLTQISK